MWAALRQLGDCGLAKRECCGRAPATILAQVHKHPHNCRSHDNASYDLARAQAALRRFVNRESCSGCQLRPWLTLRRTNIRTTAEATTTPASTVTQAALRRSASANVAGRAAASTLAQVRRLRGDRQARMLRSGASFDPGSGAQTSAQPVEPRQRRLRPWLTLRRLCGD
jgi:hypothetical protein